MATFDVRFIDTGALLSVQTGLAHVGSEIPKRVAEVVADFGDKVALTAQDIAPRRSGVLAASISSETIRTGGGTVAKAIIGSNVKHGKYVEWGTSKMAPEPYLSPALDAWGDQFARAAAEAAVEGLL